MGCVFCCSKFTSQSRFHHEVEFLFSASPCLSQLYAVKKHHDQEGFYFLKKVFDWGLAYSFRDLFPHYHGG